MLGEDAARAAPDKVLTSAAIGNASTVETRDGGCPIAAKFRGLSIGPLCLRLAEWFAFPTKCR